MFPVFSNLSDLSQKESIKERQNIEVKRTKTKSLVAQTSVTKKKKKKKRRPKGISHGVVVSTRDSESRDQGSNPCGRIFQFFLQGFRITRRASYFPEQHKPALHF